MKEACYSWPLFENNTQCFEYFIIFVFVLTCAFIIGSRGIKHINLNSSKSYWITNLNFLNVQSSKLIVTIVVTAFSNVASHSGLKIPNSKKHLFKMSQYLIWLDYDQTMIMLKHYHICRFTRLIWKRDMNLSGRLSLYKSIQLRSVKRCCLENVFALPSFW